MNAKVSDSHGLISRGSKLPKSRQILQTEFIPGKAVSEVVSCGGRLSVVGHAGIRKRQSRGPGRILRGSDRSSSHFWCQAGAKTP